MQVTSRLIALGAASAIFSACSARGHVRARSRARPRSPVRGAVRGPSPARPRRSTPTTRPASRSTRAASATRASTTSPRRASTTPRRGLPDRVGRSQGRHRLRGQHPAPASTRAARRSSRSASCRARPTAKATLANPTIAFGQVDATWNSAGADGKAGTADDPPPGVPANFTGLDYQVDQAAMLAGYLAASWSASRARSRPTAAWPSRA